AASGAPVARSGASGTDAGRPVVGSDIREIPSPGRANERRGWHSSGGAGAGGPSGALGQNAEIDSYITFFVVSFATHSADCCHGAIGDCEEDETGNDGRGNRKWW